MGDNDKPNEDIDAQFETLIAGVEDLDLNPDSLSDPRKIGEDGSAVADDLDASPDDPLHLDGDRLSVGLVLAPISSPSALHSLLALSGVHEAVVRLKPWTAVWMQIEGVEPEDELETLLGGKRAMPPAVDRVAASVSRLSKFGSVAMMSWLVEGEGVEVGVSGQITARRYVRGKPEDDIPAGVLLGSMPPATEDLLLGRTTPSDYDDSVASDGTYRRKPGPGNWFRRR